MRPVLADTGTAPSIPDAPLDLFPLRHWRSIHARLWARHSHRLLEAPHPDGEPGLQEALARLVCTARGFQADPSEIVIASHPAAAIGAIAAALDDRRSVALTADPECPSLLGGLTAHRVSCVPMHDDSDPIVALASPALHVPTGVTLNGAGRQGLLRWAATGRWIIERDCSGWAASLGGRPVPPLKADPRANRVIYVRGFEEVLFPGLPLCLVVAPREVAPAIRSAVSRQPWHPSRADQLAFQAFIEEGYFAAHLRRLMRTLPDRRETLIHLLRQAGGPRLRTVSTRLPRHLLLEASAGDAATAAARFRSAGLSVQTIERTESPTLLLIGYGGLTVDHARSVELHFRRRAAA